MKAILIGLALAFAAATGSAYAETTVIKKNGPAVHKKVIVKQHGGETHKKVIIKHKED